jgi:hypothetical protein
MKRKWEVTMGYNGAAHVRSRDYDKDSKEHERFMQMTKTMEGGHMYADTDSIITEPAYAPVRDVIRAGLWGLHSPSFLPVDCYNDCRRISCRANWLLHHDSVRHYFFEHWSADHGDVNVTIVDGPLTARISACRDACMAILNRRRDWILDKHVCALLARTLWATRYNEEWDM